ncbi:hypothetical protein HOY80DRAFT_1087461 [Tuber brumale]|nr:hypothetical protein HOY80DRAFT_1087461 [Tuber brumale]
MPRGPPNPSERAVYSPLSDAAIDQPSQSQGARVQGQDLDLIQEKQQQRTLQSRQTASPTTGLASSLEPGRDSQPYDGMQHRPASGEPPSPAMTTSDVHGHSRSSSVTSSSSEAETQAQRPGFQYSPMLIRHMTLGSEEPLRYEANLAIQGGWVRDGESMVHRRGVEEGWLSVSRAGVSESDTASSVTLGREMIEDGIPDEQSMDG